MIKLKISFRFVVTIISIIMAILLGLTRISDPEFIQVLRLKYFDQLQIKYPRVTTLLPFDITAPEYSE